MMYECDFIDDVDALRFVNSDHLSGIREWTVIFERQETEHLREDTEILGEVD